MTTNDDKDLVPILDYLKNSQQQLSDFHRGWDNHNSREEKRPICIPPSLDLLKKYHGSYNERAEGFDKKKFKQHQANIVPEMGQGNFLDVMRNIPHGGILIGQIVSQHITNESPYRDGGKLELMAKDIYELVDKGKGLKIKSSN